MLITYSNITVRYTVNRKVTTVTLEGIVYKDFSSLNKWLPKSATNIEVLKNEVISELGAVI